MTSIVRGNPAAFVVVGGLAAGVHLATAFVLVTLANVAPAIANVLAFACAFPVSYAGHNRHSFRAARKADGSMWRWLRVSLFGFVANQGLYLLALHAFPQIWYLLLSALVTMIVAVISYLLGKRWAFAAA